VEVSSVLFIWVVSFIFASVSIARDKSRNADPRTGEVSGLLATKRGGANNELAAPVLPTAAALAGNGPAVVAKSEIIEPPIHLFQATIRMRPTTHNLSFPSLFTPAHQCVLAEANKLPRLGLWVGDVASSLPPMDDADDDVRGIPSLIDNGNVNNGRLSFVAPGGTRGEMEPSITDIDSFRSPLAIPLWLIDDDDIDDPPDEATPSDIAIVVVVRSGVGIAGVTIMVLNSTDGAYGTLIAISKAKGFCNARTNKLTSNTDVLWGVDSIMVGKATDRMTGTVKDEPYDAAVGLPPKLLWFVDEGMLPLLIVVVATSEDNVTPANRSCIDIIDDGKRRNKSLCPNTLIQSKHRNSREQIL
jgi:hypothetical protein